jgi:hypothetical membrane protein
MEKKKITFCGLILWIISFIWFNFAQLIVGSKWIDPKYSWSINNISDLGEIQSPLHNLINATFIFQGIAIIFGLWTINFIWEKNKSSKITRIVLTMAGMGFIVAGLAPADVHENIHVVLGAIPIFLFGNIGLIITLKSVNRNFLGKLWILSPLLGIIGFVGGFLFFSGHYLGLGKGGMERVWGYVLLIWLFVIGWFGLYKIKNTGNSIQSKTIA